jgi:uncharacterized protein
MKKQSKPSNIVVAAIATEVAESVEANIKTYSHVWDEILNNRNIEMFNDSNFDQDVVIHGGPEDVIGIDQVKAHYNNFLIGFSNIQFTINDIFGQDNKLAKRWNFKGTHTGEFFGIPATGRTVSLDGATFIRMSNGKIAEERDFYDNLDFMTQLGLIPPAG